VTQAGQRRGLCWSRGASRAGCRELAGLAAARLAVSGSGARRGHAAGPPGLPRSVPGW
jgi:hypothetical protein